MTATVVRTFGILSFNGLEHPKELRRHNPQVQVMSRPEVSGDVLDIYALCRLVHVQPAPVKQLLTG